MITKMTGLLVRVLDDEVRLAIGAFEYQLLVPEAVRRVVQSRVGQEVTFHVTEYFEGNSSGNRFIPRRIGFQTEAELDFFDLFCTVEKIGAKKALKAMARPVRDIADAIHRQDNRWLSTLPGIGPTTAEQIVTSLKRKVATFAALPTTDANSEEPTVVDVKGGGKKKPTATATAEQAAHETRGRLIEDVYEALMGLGHTPVEARGLLDGLVGAGKSFTSIDEALKLIYSHRG